MSPTNSGCAWRIEFQNASVVCPESMRPEASVIVPEMTSGSVDAGLVEQRQRGVDRRLGVERVEDRLDQQQIDAAEQQSRGAASR